MPSLDGESQSTESSLNGMPAMSKAAYSCDQNAPIDPPSDFDVDKALSGMLMGLSLETRLTIEEEIHGVRSEREESPDFLEEKLKEFDRILFTIKSTLGQEQRSNHRNSHRKFLLRNVIRVYGDDTKEKNAKSTLDKPETNTNDCYLNDPHVRLRFLRSESFDVGKAVERIICFLEFTSELYGEFVAERPISVTDFSKQEEYCLRHSRSQYLPFRDRSGRRVQVGVGSINFNIPAYIRFKIIMLLQWVVSEDIETQRKGIVIVLWPFDEQTESSNSSSTTIAQKKLNGAQEASDPENEHNWENIRQSITKDTSSYFQKYNNSSPLRIASIHQFYKDTPLNRALSALYVFYGLKKEQWSLYRAHFGEEVENRYKLTNFGIPESLMPMTTTGKVKTDYQSNWVTTLKKIEEQRRQQNKDTDSESCPKQEIVECPSSNDVVFRKGRPLYKRNPGNMFYRELIAAASFQHFEAARSGKYAISWNIVKEIESNGGRFLEWSSIGHGSGGMWIVMTDRRAIRDKIASALKQYNRDNLKTRNRAKAENKKKSQNGEGSLSSGTRHREQSESKAISSTPNNAGINHPFLERDLEFASVPNKNIGIENNNDRRPYMFLQPDLHTLNGTTKRRRIGFVCDDVGSRSRPETRNVNVIPNLLATNKNTIYDQQNQSNNQPFDSKPNDAAGCSTSDNDSACFGKMFFPTI